MPINDGCNDTEHHSETRDEMWLSLCRDECSILAVVRARPDGLEFVTFPSDGSGTFASGTKFATA
jgi:hypothetical protein